MDRHLSKKQKEDWIIFLGKDGRRHYNKLCCRCDKDCKQSFKAEVIGCKNYKPK